MAKKRFSPEQVVTPLRQIELATSSGNRLELRAGKRGDRIRAPPRSAQRRDLLQPQGGQDRDRAMARALQHHPAARIAAIPAAGSSNARAADVPSRWDIGHHVFSIDLVQNIRQAKPPLVRRLSVGL